MEYIRRCMLAFALAILAACSTIQAPQSDHSQVSNVTTATLNSSSSTSTESLPESTQDRKPSSLAKAISEHYKCSLQTAVDAVKYAEKFAYSDFPKKEDLLAVMAVESKFNPNASFRGSKGVMQVLVKTHKDKVVYPFTFEEQTRTGARILRENFLSLNNSSSAAVMAYNIGLGAYQKGRKSRHYLAKFNTQLAWIKSQERGPRLV